LAKSFGKKRKGGYVCVPFEKDGRADGPESVFCWFNMRGARKKTLKKFAS
jgi:hypothetical protein